MSAKILKFTPRPDNKLYFSQTPSMKKSPSVPVKPEITYLESLKIKKSSFTKKEQSALAKLNFFWDEQYQACYPPEESFDCELVEKRGTQFFYLEVIPFNLYPSAYRHFKSFQKLLDFLASRYPDCAG